jgi:hypothetical protein
VPATARAGEAPSFRKDVAPLLQARCLKCHSGSRARGDLDLSTRAGLLAGGTHGPVLEPGKSAKSPLFTHVRDKKMPPRAPLAAAEVELLRRWVDAGAPWEGGKLVAAKLVEAPTRAGPDWWSLQPIRRPLVPAVSARAWARNPIDGFVLTKLEAKGISPAPEADRRALIRRLHFDLLGLPPAPEEVEEFVNDSRPDAYERLVDRLLASPAYGERWGRHWLDVVRFAESHGYEMNTLRPTAWPYRDYVIRAFNEDRPFPRFVREQLAGDVVGRGDFLSEAATGFLVGGPHDLVGNATVEGKLQQRADDLADLVATTGATFLGLTVGCARCHDHKFDPIAQRDFYALQAVFAGVEHAERDLASGPAGERRRRADEARAALARLDAEADDAAPLAGPPGTPRRRAGLVPGRNVERFRPIEANFVRFTVAATTDGTEPCIDELEVYGPAGPDNLALASRGARPSASSVFPNNPLHKLEHLNDGRHGNGRSWISAERGKGWAQIELSRPARIDRVVWGRDREGRFRDRLARDYRVEVSLDGKKWQAIAGSWDRLPPGRPAAAPPELLPRRRALEARLRELERPARAYAGTFRAPDVVHLLKRGDVMQKGLAVGPGAVEAVRPALAIPAGAAEPERRRALADWLAHPDNPLPARVLVNRLWHWHFGQGIVRTPSDFGLMGDRPSHPELLDWLARELIDGGGHLKPIHRLIVTSATYRQGSRWDVRAGALDAGNRLLWRFAPRRLEAEAVRDTVLWVSGALDRTMGGPGYHLWDYSGYVIVFKPRARLGPEAMRRMVYQFKPRLQQDGTFGAFDCPDATAAVPRRNVSTTALQALNLLNDPFLLEQAGRLSERVKAEAGADVAAQVTRAFALAFGRAPTPREASAAERLVRAHGLAVLCRALFNANELVYVN